MTDWGGMIDSAGSDSGVFGFPSDQFNAYKSAVRGIESGSRGYGIMGGAGGKYAGAYQMGSGAITDAAKALGIPAPSRQQFLSNPQMQDQFMEAYTKVNHDRLMRNPTYAAMAPQEKLKILGYAWNQGSGGANKYLRTGQVGSDAFGTPGTKYADAIGASLSQGQGQDWGGMIDSAGGQQQASAAPAPSGGMSIGDTLKTAASNVPSDLASNVMGVLQQTANPVGTGLEFGKELATNPQMRQQLGQHFANYLSAEGLKKNIAEHPVGTALDVASLVAPIGMGERATAAAGEAVAPKILSSAALKEAGGAGLNVAKESGVYFTPEFVKPLSDTLQQIAKNRNFRPGRPGASEFEHILTDVNAMSERSWSFDDIQALQQDLNDAWKVSKKSGRDQLAGLAGRMRGIVGQFLDKVSESKGEGMVATGDLTPQQATHLFQESNKIYRQAKVAQKLESIGAKASVDAPQFAQSGEANALRKYVRQTLRAHYDGKPTGLNSQEIKTLEEFNKGSFSEWMLKQGRRYLSGPIGAGIGALVGGPAGAVITPLIGQQIAKTADRMAVQRFNNFVQSVRQEGSQRLEGLLGQAAHEHLMGTPKGKSAISNWVSKIGTVSSKAATKSLAIAVAQATKRQDLYPRILQEISSLADQLQGTAPSEAGQNQQQ